MLSVGNRNVLRPAIRCLALAAALIVLLRTLSAQQTPTPASPPQPNTPESGYMRVLIRPTHPAVFDAQHRPITAGAKQEITLPGVDQIFAVDEIKGLK